jgi:membrane dipeptidase
MIGWPAMQPSRRESFSYLVPGADFRDISVADPRHRVSTFDVRLTDSELARVHALLRDEVIISFHDHPQSLPVDPGQSVEYLRSRRDHTAFRELRRSNVTAIFDNLVSVIGASTAAGWKWDDLITALGMRLADIAHQDDVLVARTVSDIRAAKNADKVAFILGTESAGAIENELDRIDLLYGFGVRQMGLVYADSNSLGSGQKELADAGLTMFGRRAVKRMNQLGVLIDVSHASDLTCLDAIRTSSAPVAITHAGARAIWDIPRLKPDKVLRACAETGGVLGIEAAPRTTASHRHPAQNIESVMDHFTYAVELMGIEHVAFGPDTFFGDHVGFQKAISSYIGIDDRASSAEPRHEPVAFVDGMENPAENFGNVTRWLVKHGYSDSEIRAVLGGNIMRLLAAAWQAAR